MNCEERGRESGGGHGHCRGRGRGVQVPMPNAPVIARGPTARGSRSSMLRTTEDLGGTPSGDGVARPFPVAFTATGWRGRGRGAQVPVANILAPTSGPQEEGVQATMISSSRDTDNAEGDRGASAQMPEARTTASGRGRGGGVPVSMPDAPTAAGVRGSEGGAHVPISDAPAATRGRGRGRGAPVQKPEVPTETFDPADGGVKASISSAPRETGGPGRGRKIKQVSPPIVSTPLVASGPAGREIQSALASTCSAEVDSTPTPGLDAEEEDTSKIVEKELKTLQEMFDYKFKSTKKGKSDRHIMCENWNFAKGINRPVMVISMNEYVNSDEVYIPGEIVITPFTLKYGIDLLCTYSTLVDPGKNIPVEHEMEASNNVTNFDLPKPGTCDEKRYKDYERIAREIEIFIKANSTPAFFGERDASGDVYFLFCKKEMVDRYTKGLNWLFALEAKEKFPFKLVPLESILVVLSLGGLELEAARRGSVLECFQKVVESFNDAVISVQDTTVTSTEELMQTAHDLLTKFAASADIRKYIQRFLSRGGKWKRVACRRLLRHPYAFLGAFMSEDQATQYLDTQDYINQRYLACAYHTESDKMGTCAQLEVARMIYLALDVLLVNYGNGNHGIRPKDGKHVPLIID